MIKKFKSGIIIFLLVCFLMPVSEVLAAPALRTSKFFGRQYVSLHSIGNRYGLRVNARDGRIYLYGRHHKFSFTVNKMASSFNGVQMTLSHALHYSRGLYYVSKIDYDTMLLPLINRKNMRRHKVETVFIDPGHGGKDVGAEGRYFYEKNLTLKLAAKVRRILRNNKINVIMSRRSDVFVSLQNRIAVANRHKADVFVSIHFNSAANKKVYGLETYCMTPAGASSSNARKIDWKSYPGNAYDRNNFALAYLMQRSMRGYSKGLDRGVKHGRFLVLKEAKMPAVLVECGFLSNPNSERIIGTEKYLNQIAKGIAHAVINYKKVAENAGH